MSEMRIWPAPAASSSKDGQKSQVAEEEETREHDVDFDESRPLIHVEARLRDTSNIQPRIIHNLLYAALVDSDASFKPSTYLSDFFRSVDLLDEHIHSVWLESDALCCAGGAASGGGATREATQPDFLIFRQCRLQVHVYANNFGSWQVLGLANEEDDETTSGENEDTSTPAASVLQLPEATLDGLWQNLIFDTGIKEGLLTYIQTTMLFAEAEVNTNVISYNRVVLLHGPPGTGKTSLCRALTQKLSIRLSDAYASTQLVEIHAHSLFSKWFSESGKMVQKLFDAIHQLLEDAPDSFLVVLVDEVESLTAAREGVVGGKEPSDALRVVNALLTQLDRLKQRPNVLVMTTSNLTHAIDPAFIDRADIKQFIGLPNAEAIYFILSSCLAELREKSLLKGPLDLSSWTRLKNDHDHSSDCSRRLAAVARLAQDSGVSGRLLRRIPILAHARYVARQPKADLSIWIEAFYNVVREEVKQSTLMQRDNQ